MPLKVTILAAAQRLVVILPKTRGARTSAVAPVLALEEVIVQLKDRLTKALKTKFSNSSDHETRSEVIVNFSPCSNWSGAQPRA